MIVQSILFRFSFITIISYVVLCRIYIVLFVPLHSRIIKLCHAYICLIFNCRSRDVENGGVGALHVVGIQAVLTEYLIRFSDLIFDEKASFLSSSEQEGI